MSVTKTGIPLKKSLFFHYLLVSHECVKMVADRQVVAPVL